MDKILNHYKKILIVIWLIVASVSIYYIYKNDVSVDMIKSYISAMSYWGALVYILAYTIRPLVLFPTSIMTPVAAMLFGPYLGWVLASVGELFSASIAFFVARFLARDLVLSHENEFIKKYDKKLTSNGFETILFLRLVPLFPFDFVNYSSGLSGIRFKSYVVATMLGVVPGLTAYIFLGESFSNPWVLLPTIILFVLLMILSKFLKNKYGKNYKL